MPVAAASARRLAAAWQALPNTGWRPVPDANQHLTLLFLGPLDGAGVQAALATVRGLNGHGLRAVSSRCIGLPRAGSARVAAAEVEADPRLAAWHDFLASALSFPSSGFRPHVTLARCPQPRRLPARRWPAALALQLGAPRLLRSVSAPGGVRYEVVEDVAD